MCYFQVLLGRLCRDLSYCSRRKFSGDKLEAWGGSILSKWTEPEKSTWRIPILVGGGLNGSGRETGHFGQIAGYQGHQNLNSNERKWNDFYWISDMMIRKFNLKRNSKKGEWLNDLYRLSSAQAVLSTNSSELRMPPKTHVSREGRWFRGGHQSFVW